MKTRGLGLYVLLAFGVAACTKSPISPAGTITGTVAVPTSPANGAQIANLAQPVTLIVSNATVTESSAFVTYTFEVATDAAFSNKVITKDVPQTPGQTLLKLDTLPAGRDYFWHVRTTGSDTVGQFSAPVKFTIGPAIIIQPPTPALPAAGSTTANARPTLTINNSSRSGPVGALAYLFQIATDSAFNNVVSSDTVPEAATATQTSFTPAFNLAFTTTFFWHARATDTASGIATAFSTPVTFVTPAEPNPLWPGIQPPGTTGHAVKGDNWQEQDLISFGGVRFHSPTLEMKRLFDLMDRGFDPQGAIDWMHANGYPTDAAWFPAVQVIGLQYVYLALIRGRWDMVLRSE